MRCETFEEVVAHLDDHLLAREWSLENKHILTVLGVDPLAVPGLCHVPKWGKLIEDSISYHMQV